MIDSGVSAPLLRSAGPSDLDRIVQLAVAFYAEDGFTTPSDELRRNLTVLLHSTAARTAVVEIDGLMVAFAVTTTSFGLESGLVAELEDLFVVRRARRTGLAGRLIEDSAAWAGGQGAHHLELVVAAQGHDVSHLHNYYRARGFHDDGRRLLSRPL